MKLLPSRLWRRFVFVVAIMAATAAIGAILLTFTQQNVLYVYGTMLFGVFGSKAGLIGMLTYATPLMLTGLAATVAFRMKIFNIGGDGQLFMGAVGASGAALSFPDLPGVILLPLVVISGIVAGGVWGLVPAVLRVVFGVNEVMSSLMLNYVAKLGVAYLIFGPWRDPTMAGWPYSPLFPEAAWLPSWGHTNVNLTLLIAILLAPLLAWAYTHTRWGYEVAIIGGEPRVAEYASIGISRNILIVMFISGGLAGLAGVGEVAGVAHRLYELNPQGYGYIGIMVAWLAGLRPIPVLVVALLFGSLLQGGVALQMGGLPPSIVYMLQGLIVLVTLGSMAIAHGSLGRVCRAFLGRRESALAPSGSRVQ